MSGKRESKPDKGTQTAGWWRQHREWVAGLNRRQKVRYRLFQVLVVLAILAIAVCLALRAWIQLPEIPELPAGTEISEDGTPMFEGAELPEAAQSGRRDDVYTFLLVGQDTKGGGNTDTMILITFDSAAKQVYGMSLPRDTMVNVSTSSKRLNAVYNYNKGRDADTQVEKGMRALKAEVGKLTGIIPDYYVIVQWEAVGELVDAIDGVWFEVPFDMNYDDPYQDLHIHQEAGYRLLSGDDAMQVIRWRKNNGEASGGDVARIPIQQDFLKAAISQCLKPEILLKAPSLAQIFLENVETDLTMGNILAFAQLASGMDTENDVTFLTMPWTDAHYPGVSMVLPVLDELVELLNDGFNPYQDDIKASDLSVLYRNSDGSYGVTNGTLLDSSLARPRGGGGSSSSGGGGSGDETELPGESDENPDAEEVPPEPPDGSQPSGGEDPGGAQEPGGSQTQEPAGPDGEQPPAPSGSEGQTEPGGSSSSAGDGESETETPPSQDIPNSPDESAPDPAEEQPPSQDIQGGGGGLTVADLPDWLRPDTGAAA